MLDKSELVEMSDYQRVCEQAYNVSMDELVKWLEEHTKAEYFQVLWDRVWK